MFMCVYLNKHFHILDPSQTCKSKICDQFKTVSRLQVKQFICFAWMRPKSINYDWKLNNENDTYENWTLKLCWYFSLRVYYRSFKHSIVLFIQQWRHFAKRNKTGIRFYCSKEVIILRVMSNASFIVKTISAAKKLSNPVCVQENPEAYPSNSFQMTFKIWKNILQAKISQRHFVLLLSWNNFYVR